MERLEQGIIRQGPRENVTGNRYLNNNPLRRIGLDKIIPVDNNGDKISPMRIANTGTTTIVDTWTNSEGTHDSYKTNSFITVNGVSVSHDSNNVYVQGNGIINHTLNGGSIANHEVIKGGEAREVAVSYNIPKKDLASITETANNGRQCYCCYGKWIAIVHC